MSKIELYKYGLTTESSGFLRSHLYERVIEIGAQVSCVDGFYSNSKSNVSDLEGHSNFELIHHNTTLSRGVLLSPIPRLLCTGKPRFIYGMG